MSLSGQLGSKIVSVRCAIFIKSSNLSETQFTKSKMGDLN